MVLGRKHSHPDFVKQAAATATHYGFVPFEELLGKVAAARKDRTERMVPIPNSTPSRSSDVAGMEFTKTLRLCGENGLLARKQPVLFFHTTFDLARKNIERKDAKTFSFGLQAYGTGQSVGEAVVLKAALSILEGIMGSNVTVYLNSIGDRDSKARYGRELGFALRKHAGNLPTQAEALMRDDPLEALTFLLKKKHPLVDELPRPVEFLSAGSRRHFREVLEQLEAAGISYELEDFLMGPKDYYSETVFEIRTPSNGEETEEVEDDLLVRGGRYDELPKRMFKTSLPAVGIVFNLQHPASAIFRENPSVRVRQPKVYFIHLGAEAKLHSLSVIETLRLAKIPFHHSIADSGFSEQISSAERLGVPYLIIMGQKEAVESSVIVRNIATRAQETVPITRLPIYFKNVKA